MIKKCIFSLVFLSVFWACNHDSSKKIDLSGEWRFAIDSLDQGEQLKWFDLPLAESVHLPGSMDENGKGDPISLKTQWTGGVQNPQWHTDPNYAPYFDENHIRFPFWLQPDKKYTGAAWYQKDIEIPASWKGKQIHLFLERCHWESTVWIDSEKIGMENSLGTAHEFVLPSSLSSGKHRLTIRVDNRIKETNPGHDSHSVTDHTQTNWNGIVGEICIKTTDPVFISGMQVYSDVQTKNFTVEAEIINSMKEPQSASFTLSAKGKNFISSEEKTKTKAQLEPGKNTIKIELKLDKDAVLWDEFSPNVYALKLEAKGNGFYSETATTAGLREFKADGSRFAVNGRPVFLRGTLECAIFPKTGYPATDTTEWERIMRVIKSHGLNHIRFHSWCPPEAAFVAADESGIYLQVECSSWANAGSSIGDGAPIDEYIWNESKRIVRNYGNHPSFCMMAYGNEPGGKNQREYLTKFVSYWKETDPRRVYTGGAGWPVLDAQDYHNIPQPRIQGWGEQLNSIINSQAPRSDYDWSRKVPADGKPVVSHEIGQWCAYPNFKEIDKYTGVLKAKNFELFRESLKDHGMAQLADSFLLASGKLQALCYKADIEAALRTPGFAGFQLLDLHDFPGQGTALVGVLDAFWEEKGYISSKEYSRFCNAVVPLVRLPKHIFSDNDTLSAIVEVANFSNTNISDVDPIWTLKDSNGNLVAESNFGKQNIQVGQHQIGAINYQFIEQEKPRQLKLEVSLNEYSNSWDIWVYPAKNQEITSEIIITEKLDKKIITALENGANVLLSIGKGRVKEGKGGEVGLGFSSIFWNTAWTRGQKPHTLGILCNPNHPALAEFPTEYHSNWQWWDAVSHADAINIGELSRELNPIVRIIDDWVTNRPLALLFEAKVGKGRILVSGTDLVNELDQRREARQLLFSLKKYMDSQQFSPNTELSSEDIKSIIR